MPARSSGPATEAYNMSAGGPGSTYGNTEGDVTSQNLWPGCDRHFVGLTRHNVWS